MIFITRNLFRDDLIIPFITHRNCAISWLLGIFLRHQNKKPVYLSFCNQNWLCWDCFVREEKRCYICGLSFLWVLLPNVGRITTIFEPWGLWHNTMLPFYIPASQYPRMITWTVFVGFQRLEYHQWLLNFADGGIFLEWVVAPNLSGIVLIRTWKNHIRSMAISAFDRITKGL